jgi:hypothetical protein
MDRDTGELLRTSLRHALVETASDADPGSLARRLDELGWRDVVADDRAGAWTALFTVKGEVLAGGLALDLVVADELAAATDSGRAGAGPSTAVPIVVIPIGGAQPASRLDGHDLSVRGLAGRAPGPDDTVAVPVAVAGGSVRVALTTGDGRLAWQPVAGLDPELGLGIVTGTVPAADRTWLADGPEPADPGPDQPSLWDRLVATARWALAAELAGVAGRMVASAAEYAGSRMQYGRPIGTFQAVQHRLAEAHTLTVGAAGVVAEAAEAAGPAGRPGWPWAAVVAKALAGQACEHAGVEAQQVFGAIGFTWEHGLHRALRRGGALDLLFGDWRSLERHVGEQLLERRTVPRVGAL